MSFFIFFHGIDRDRRLTHVHAISVARCAAPTIVGAVTALRCGETVTVVQTTDDWVPFLLDLSASRFNKEVRLITCDSQSRYPDLGYDRGRFPRGLFILASLCDFVGGACAVWSPVPPILPLPPSMFVHQCVACMAVVCP